jgi:predicted SAM-dependent methyltransferase
MAVNRRIISDYLCSHPVAKLQIGAGTVGATSSPWRMPGWLNTDIEPCEGEAYLDATKTFPIPDGSLNYIFSEHLYEHLSYRDGLTMLRESHRTLKPGGKIRIATPDLSKLLAMFQNPKPEEIRNYIYAKFRAPYWEEELPQTVSPECVILNGVIKSWGHRFVYDPQTLRECLERAGFQNIKQFTPGESDDPELRGMEARHKWSNHAINDYETMVFEGTRL